MDGMESLRDLAGAPRKGLLALIARQRAALGQQQAIIAALEPRLAGQHQLAALQQRLSELEGDGGAGAAKGMPGLGPKSAKPVRPKAPRKLRSQAFGHRRRTPTERVAHPQLPDLAARWVDQAPP